MFDNRVFAVAGAKGGVGKTTTALNLGGAYADAGAEVAVAELDLAMANVVDFLDLDVDVYRDPTLHDVLAGEARIEDAVYADASGMDVLPSGVAIDGFRETDVDRLDRIVEWLRERYDVVLLDTGAGLSRETLVPLALADSVVLVSTPRVAAVRDTEKTAQLIDRVGGEPAGVLFTKSGTGAAPGVERIAAFLELDLLGHVPEDEAVPASQDVGRPVVTHAPESDAAEAYRETADELRSGAERETLVRSPESRMAADVLRESSGSASEPTGGEPDILDSESRAAPFDGLETPADPESTDEARLPDEEHSIDGGRAAPAAEFEPAATPDPGPIDEPKPGPDADAADEREPPVESDPTRDFETDGAAGSGSTGDTTSPSGRPKDGDDPASGEGVDGAPAENGDRTLGSRIKAFVGSIRAGVGLH